MEAGTGAELFQRLQPPRILAHAAWPCEFQLPPDLLRLGRLPVFTYSDSVAMGENMRPKRPNADNVLSMRQPTRRGCRGTSHPPLPLLAETP